MTKFFTFFSIFLICIGSSSVLGQTTMLNDFETGSPNNVSRYGLVSNITIVNNPFSTSFNSTAKCAKISRTTINWYELFAFPVNFTIPANTKKYLHMKVNYYAQPDIAIRFDGANENADGAVAVRALNKYTDLGNWQDIVFELDGGLSGAAVKAILVMPDIGYENTPAQLVLNNSDKFGYIDEISVNDSATPFLKVNDFEIDNSIAIYPNPTNDILNVTNLLPDTVVSIFTIDGKNVYNGKSITNNLSLSIKGWSKGLYIF